MLNLPILVYGPDPSKARTRWGVSMSAQQGFINVAGHPLPTKGPSTTRLLGAARTRLEGSGGVAVNLESTVKVESTPAR